MGHREHQQKGKRRVSCAILTISDTRTRENDESGQRIHDLLQEAGHEVLSWAIVPDEPVQIRDRIRPLLADSRVEIVLLNGGTGIAPRDTTFEAVGTLLDKVIDGFGELFRMLSYEEIGSAAMLSRAVAGIASGTVLVSMPGSTAAVDLAMRKLVLPELGHMAHLLEA
jgi:molybdenum cofactor biosynthesis protein B